LEEPSRVLDFAKAGFDLLGGKMGKEELEEIARHEEDQEHCFSGVGMVGIQMLGVHQGIEHLEPIVLDVPSPMGQLPHLSSGQFLAV
jgi:hypothetical protein